MLLNYNYLRDLIIYKLQHPIHDDPFDIPTLLSLSLAQKKTY
jgi:hypothetical protein